MHLSVHIIGFITCTAVIFYCGNRLSKYGGMMADLLGWGKMFLGIILMASVTSMPELMAGISSVVIIDAPDMAVGDIVGSCAFNILILSMMDFFYSPKKSLTSAAQSGHIIAASFGIILLSTMALAIVMPDLFGRIGWIGGYSLLFISLYLIAIRVIYLYEQKQVIHSEIKPAYSLSLKQVVSRYVINAFFVIVAAIALPFFGKHLAESIGLGQGFFGTLFLAISTSLPEIVVTAAAIRMGFIDLAIGNIFGSNIFNMLILAIDDVFYVKGPIFSYTSPSHIIAVVGTIIITAIGMAGIIFRPGKKWKLATDSAAILMVYVLMIVLLYIKGK